MLTAIWIVATHFPRLARRATLRLFLSKVTAHLAVAIVVGVWIVVVSVCLTIPFVEGDLTIKTWPVSVHASIVRTTWLAFDIIIVHYWISEFIRGFKRNAIGSPANKV
jgi:hypothetical protein